MSSQLKNFFPREAEVIQWILESEGFRCMQLKNTVMFLNESSQVECLCWLEKPALTEVDKVESESESESSVVCSRLTTTVGVSLVRCSAVLRSD